MMCDIDRKNGKKYCEISLYTIVDAIYILVLQTMLCKTVYNIYSKNHYLCRLKRRADIRIANKAEKDYELQFVER